MSPLNLFLDAYPFHGRGMICNFARHTPVYSLIWYMPHILPPFSISSRAQLSRQRHCCSSSVVMEQGTVFGMHRAIPRKPCIVVMGVSGSGKSSVGRFLASHLQSAFVDADDYHSISNVEKMRAGTPLTDADRWPWLRVLAELIDQHLSSDKCLVMACSALKEAYRDALRGRHAEDITFVLLKLSREKLLTRMEVRQALGTHFMPAALLDSQLATLEEGGRGMMIVSGENTIEEVVADILGRII